MRRVCWISFLENNLKIREYLEIISPKKFYMVSEKHSWVTVVIDGFTDEGKYKLYLIKDNKTGVIEGSVLKDNL